MKREKGSRIRRRNSRIEKKSHFHLLKPVHERVVKYDLYTMQLNIKSRIRSQGLIKTKHKFQELFYNLKLINYSKI